jgi:hypothetical protein
MMISNAELIMDTIARRVTIHAAALCIACAPFASHAESIDEWEWMVAPYVWAASIGTDLDTGIPPTDSDSNFSDIIDKIDGAFQVHAEGQGERFGVFTDFTYLGLEDSKNFPRVSTRTNLDSRLFELAGVWSPSEGRLKGLELFGGLRYIDVDLSVDFDPVNPLFDSRRHDIDKSYSDFMLGVRYTWAMGERWRLTLRGDGSTGDTDGTWNVSAVGQYRVKHGAWLFGYRYLSVDIEERNNNVDITMNGPMVGFGFIF